MFTANPVLSRLMAVALLISLIAAVWIVGISPILQQDRAYRDDIARSERLIAAFEARKPDIDGLKKAIDSLRNDPATRRSFIDARNPTLGAAKLQSRIKALTEAAGAQLVSSQIVSSDKRSDGFPAVVVRIQMVATAESLRQIVHALETGRPALFLDNVNIAARRIPRRARGAAPRESGLLTIRYDAYGYLWTGEGSA